MQDCIKYGKFGLVTRPISPLKWQAATGGIAITRTISEVNWPVGGGASSFMWGPDDLPLGAIITEIRGVLHPNAGNTMRVSWSSSLAGVGTVLATQDTTVPAADNNIVLTGPFPPIATATSYMLWARRQAGAGDADGVKLFEIDLYVP